MNFGSSIKERGMNVNWNRLVLALADLAAAIDTDILYGGDAGCQAALFLTDRYLHGCTNFDVFYVLDRRPYLF